VRSVRVATHCTEADVARQYIATARDLGMDGSGFLMTSHMAPATELARHAALMESYGRTASTSPTPGGRRRRGGSVTRVDASLAGHGAGAGNCPIEPFIAVANLQGWQHGCDLSVLQDAADDMVRPLQDRPCRSTARP
jgi:4-hydroxy 2-oxovalerate aldolase